MASKPTAPPRERIGRVGQRRQVVIPREIFEKLQMREGDFVAFAPHRSGVLVKPKRVVDPDDVLTAEQSAVMKKAEREMRQGKFVTLDQLRHDLDRPHSRRGRKTA
jgi:bifunctional DNA-binding transcriptional regulator/antitoxin component of YhaV-PrlF toxin-antitoxin module